jgi:hypothetical protein
MMTETTNGITPMTKRSLVSILFAILTLCFALSAQAEKLVREFSGSRSTETVEFEMKSPWLVDWRVNSDFPREMGIAVALINVGTESYAGRILKTKEVGNGLRLIEESGRFRFKVDAAVANWTLKAIQLNPEEAKLYTPKNDSGF